MEKDRLAQSNPLETENSLAVDRRVWLGRHTSSHTPRLSACPDEQPRTCLQSHCARPARVSSTR
jgi:hypothetical protein